MLIFDNSNFNFRKESPRQFRVLTNHRHIKCGRFCLIDCCMLKRHAAAVCDNLLQLLVSCKHNVHDRILEIILDRVLMQLVDIISEQLEKFSFIDFNIKLMHRFLVCGLLLTYFALIVQNLKSLLVEKARRQLCLLSR